MIHEILHTIEFAAATAAGLSVCYYAVCLFCAARFLADSEQRTKSLESEQDFSVSIMKPLKGSDPEMYDCFRSHCLQSYESFEIIFGVSEADDPAIELVEQLRAEFPDREISLVHCSENLGNNTKVSNLVQMLPHAHHEYIVVNDSDIRVPHDYLHRVLAPLSSSDIGLVTCPYRGVPNASLGSRLESMGIGTDFFPGVLVARAIEGMKFGLGSTLAFRRRDLLAIGGFESIVDYLADDYEIGHRLAKTGTRVELSGVIVDSLLPRYTMAEFFRHQLRWARTVKSVRPWGYAGTAITFGLPWALLALILAPGAIWAWVLLAITALARFCAAAYVSKKVLRENQAGLLRWLPIRDFLALGVWLVSFMGDSVMWRGTPYRLKEGKLAKTAP